MQLVVGLRGSTQGKPFLRTIREIHNHQNCLLCEAEKTRHQPMAQPRKVSSRCTFSPRSSYLMLARFPKAILSTCQSSTPTIYCFKYSMGCIEWASETAEPMPPRDDFNVHKILLKANGSYIRSDEFNSRQILLKANGSKKLVPICNGKNSICTRYC